jgi:hypothetical protein
MKSSIPLDYSIYRYSYWQINKIHQHPSQSKRLGNHSMLGPELIQNVGEPHSKKIKRQAEREREI